MIAKIQEKEKAITLRKRGLSYSEILKQVSVAKSTLSLWLHSVGLARQQEQRLTEKRLEACRRGALSRKNDRLMRVEKIKIDAASHIKNITKRELWLMGVMLYWAEGVKEKEWRPGQSVELINSDPYMIKLFLRWLDEIIGVSQNKLKFEIYIHENHRNRLDRVRDYWAHSVGISREYLDRIYFKKHRPKTKRRNTGESYYGIIKVHVRASSELNRKIAGWIEGVNKYYCG